MRDFSGVVVVHSSANGADYEDAPRGNIDYWIHTPEYVRLNECNETAAVRLRNGRTNIVLRQAAAGPARSIAITDEIRAKYK